MLCSAGGMQRRLVPILFGLAFGCGLAHAQGAGVGQGIYRYKNAQGRVVYTNIAEQVPLDQRATAPVDLRHVELNTETGNELHRRIAEQYAALHGSPYCKKLRAAADEEFLRRLWDDFAPLVLCGGGLLMLLLFSPAAMRRFGAPTWARVLGMAIPGLALSGLVMFSMSYTNKMIVKIKHQAKPCMRETFAKLSEEKDAVLKQSQLVEQLKREIATLEQVRQ